MTGSNEYITKQKGFLCFRKDTYCSQYQGYWSQFPLHSSVSWGLRGMPFMGKYCTCAQRHAWTASNCKYQVSIWNRPGAIFPNNSIKTQKQQKAIFGFCSQWEGAAECWLASSWVKVKWALWVMDQSREWRRDGVGWGSIPAVCIRWENAGKTLRGEEKLGKQA